MDLTREKASVKLLCESLWSSLYGDRYRTYLISPCRIVLLRQWQICLWVPDRGRGVVNVWLSISHTDTHTCYCEKPHQKELTKDDYFISALINCIWLNFGWIKDRWFICNLCIHYMYTIQYINSMQYFYGSKRSYPNLIWHDNTSVYIKTQKQFVKVGLGQTKVL